MISNDLRHDNLQHIFLNFWATPFEANSESKDRVGFARMLCERFPRLQTFPNLHRDSNVEDVQEFFKLPRKGALLPEVHLIRFMSRSREIIDKTSSAPQLPIKRRRTGGVH
eukprot:TRINITY_DN5613_c0_g2_i1.p1 TRINITY_DN5613_c0_g2~~TRINITY_DN5613_c0_g2_i1.p1  ORF type:complete len:111 (-),score=13.94 TRINITY_DN5613_c0_g2_i1:106-438(-)